MLATAAVNRDAHCFAAGFLQYPLFPLRICFSIYISSYRCKRMSSHFLFTPRQRNPQFHRYAYYLLQSLFGATRAILLAIYKVVTSICFQREYCCVIDYLPPHDFSGNSRRASGDPFILDALSLAGEFSFHSPPFISRALPNSCTLTSLTMYNPKVLIVALLFSLSLILAAKSAEQLQIGVKYVPEECPIKSRKGDRLSMQ